MVLEAFRQVDAGVSEMLARVDGASLDDLRTCLHRAKSVRARFDAFYAKSAHLIAAVERHGDSGAGALVESTGISQREARSHTETAKRLREMPRLREAVESGEVSFRNAERLAKAANETGSSAVESDT